MLPNVVQPNEDGHDSAVAARNPEQRHALAALCLHGQPFGFTREGVAAIRRFLDMAKACGSYITDPDHPDYDEGHMEIARAEVACIEALLPPEEA